MSTQDERRSAILTEVGALIGPGSTATPALIEAYYRHVLTEDLAARSSEDLLGALLAHLALARERTPGQTAVQAFTPRVETHGWAPGNTVIQVVTDDAPFIVDSITVLLDRLGEEIRLFVHPILRVQRDDAGLITGFENEDGIAESWVSVEVPRAGGQEALDTLAETVRGVVNEVEAAVADWRAMVERAEEISAGLAHSPAAVGADERGRVAELLDWLVRDHFVFLGYRRYELQEHDGGTALVQVPGSGLGLMRGDGGTPTRPLSGVLLDKALDPELLIITEANAMSTVHRAAHLDYVGVKTFDEQGRVNGEHRFIGLFTSAVHHSSVLEIPVIATKVGQVLERAGLEADSHAGTRLVNLLERYPRDDLFQSDVGYLAEVTTRIIASRFHRRTLLFARPDAFGRFTSCLVVLPRDRYTPRVRERIEAILMRAYHGTAAEHSVRVSDSTMAILHFVIRRDSVDAPTVDLDVVQEWIRAAVRTWHGEWRDALIAEFGEVEAARLAQRWADGFDEAYKAQHSPRMSAVDVSHLEALTVSDTSGDTSGDTTADAGLRAGLYQELDGAAGARRLRLYSARALELTEVLPILLDFGLRVLDERTTRVVANDGSQGYILDFGIAAEESFWRSGTGPEAGFLPAFLAVWRRRAESDPLNQLVGTANLTWMQVVVLRLVATYLRQTTPYSLNYLEAALVENAEIARHLVSLFEARFALAADGTDGADATGREQLEDAAAQGIEAALENVPSLDHDTMIRAYVDVIRAGQRTNFYQPADGLPPEAVAFKLVPGLVPHLPAPRPLVEAWVYSPRLEGVHLRFGKVARGGLRWSDRRDDFRTEVLGLVKAQMVKNSVIVPAGAKGGFCPKNLPDPQKDRGAWLAAGRSAYEQFVGALLTVTDTIRDGATVNPERVVRHDADDTYLVVAADKGTASFSDLANEVSAAYDFWLGDAFASGGSSGYDHKGMAITARGAWESVKRHFLEMDIDTQTTDFTVVGVGDMSGDVFGNGMLLSRHLKLVAAFDHRHIFIDPTPDPETSFAERERMFALPHSSWADYDTSLISTGGGVFPRSAKSIDVTPQMREALGLGNAFADGHATPAELMRAILVAPVDLLWNGGIGTYIKATDELNSEVGDRANDAIRVNGADLRCRVVGEGGNLGASQRGRIEAAQNGIRINTDAIDNSGGVDSSDQEVNIKILLGTVEAAGRMTRPQRDELLRSMTDEVAEKVLRTNYEQNVLLANARHEGAEMSAAYERLMTWLEEHGGLDRDLEALPSSDELVRRGEKGRGLTSPELAVLVAYAKLTIEAQLLDTTLPDDPWFEQELAEYFPEPLREFTDALQGHPLRREIIATRLSNSVVNRGGITFVLRAMEDTGATLAEAVKAYVVAREVFRLRDFVLQVEALDCHVPTASQCELYLQFTRLLDTGVRELLATPLGGVADEIARYASEAKGSGDAPTSTGELADQAFREVERTRGDSAA
ncbi:MAG: NAD-glutamate dehydrogenase [Dermatophilus congolensis]|nr:NAD-glutamate dehydrogenase [Dermatophilus congolensis]